MAEKAKTAQPVAATESDALAAAVSESAGLDRIKFFSDAVFAIAITLLILNVALPSGTKQSDLAHELNSIWPEYEAFAFTFLLIGLRWLTHLIQFRHIRGYDVTLLSLNLALLFVVAFLPFASKVLADYPDSRPACILYAASMAVAGVLSTALWYHACHKPSLIDPGLDSYTRKNMLLRWATVPAFFGIAILLVILVPDLWWARAVALATLLAQLAIALHAKRTGHPIM
jgi:TMEM175 potassium channel family protein